MDDVILFGVSIVLGAISGYLVAIIIIVLIIIVMWQIRKLRRRNDYNLEFPADFPDAKMTSADLDQRDRFDTEGINKHYK